MFWQFNLILLFKILINKLQIFLIKSYLLMQYIHKSKPHMYDAAILLFIV